MDGRNHTDNISLIIISIFCLVFKYSQNDNTHSDLSILTFTLTFLILHYTNQMKEKVCSYLKSLKKNYPRKENFP